MDWVTDIQRSINYIDEHLTKQIDYDGGAEFLLKLSFPAAVQHLLRLYYICCRRLGQNWRPAAQKSSTLR